jgi:hypothetical protein
MATPKQPDPSFSYRLPVTFVRVVGASHKTVSAVAGQSKTSYDAVVTTELGADSRTRQLVSLDGRHLAERKVNWTFTPDGRLSGTDVAMTTNTAAPWLAALRMGGAVAGIAAPALAAAGPIGWAGLAAATGLAAAGTAIAVTRSHRVPAGSAGMIVADEVDEDVPVQPPRLDYSVDPVAEGVDCLYVSEHPDAALTLANYRRARREAAARHSVAVLASAAGGCVDSQDSTRTVLCLERVLASVEVGLAKAEEVYRAWCTSMQHTTTTRFDERIPIDLLPTSGELLWAAEHPDGSEPWKALVTNLRLAISFDLVPDEVEGERKQPREPVIDLSPSDDVIYRGPRPGLLRIWRAEPNQTGSAWQLDERELRRLAHVVCPGNERSVVLDHKDDRFSSALAFDDNGAIVKLGAEVTDASLQRAASVADLLSATKDSLEAGQSIRAAVSGPTLVEQAAEAKAAKELGLVPTTDDPLDKLRKQVEEARLRAQLTVADQLARSASVPVFVQF